MKSYNMNNRTNLTMKTKAQVKKNQSIQDKQQKQVKKNQEANLKELTKTGTIKKARQTDILPLKDTSRPKEKTQPQIKKEIEIVKDKIIKLSNQLSQLQTQLK
jgi:hypothetical protein